MLEGVVLVIRDLPRSEVISLINPHIVKSVKGRKKTMTLHHNVEFVTNQDGELIPDVLIYVFEGVLPLLKVWKIFCD